MAFFNFIKKHWIASIAVVVALALFAINPGAIGQLIAGIVALVGLIGNTLVGIVGGKSNGLAEKHLADAQTGVDSGIAGLQITISTGRDEAQASTSGLADAGKTLGDGADAIGRALEADKGHESSGSSS